MLRGQVREQLDGSPASCFGSDAESFASESDRHGWDLELGSGLVNRLQSQLVSQVDKKCNKTN